MNELPDYPVEVNEIYQGRRDTLCGGLNRIGWEIEPPMGTMFAWAPIPEPYREMGSLEFCSFLVKEAQVALSPGVGFGPGGEGHVRFALIENEQRINQAMRNLQAGAAQARLSAARAQPAGWLSGRRRCPPCRRSTTMSATSSGSCFAAADVDPRQVVGHAEDGVGEHLGVAVGDPARDDRLLEVGDRVADQRPAGRPSSPR